VLDSDSPTFEGKYVNFKDIVMEPKPVQKPYPPIFIGGNTEIAMRRACSTATAGSLADHHRAARRCSTSSVGSRITKRRRIASRS
jgi:alkanesulfonate monooxygenase SsuD/methylene tetrahydromethanopterin reductase-like flavin-dependent oxidoreductase (luciferase family)